MQQPIPHFETGDLLLYNTTRYWYSREWFTSSNYSHVSMVLRRPTWLDPSLCEEEYYVLESGSERFPDAVSGNFKFGVQVCPLSKVWAEYASQGYGHLYVRRMRYLDAATVGQDALIDGIKTAYAKVKACPYDLNPCDWIKCYFDEHKTLEQIDNTAQRDQKTTSFWCSRGRSLRRTISARFASRNGSHFRAAHLMRMSSFANMPCKKKCIRKRI
jgi:hypothetical protein